MLKIGEFSKLAQVSVKTLRYYHQLGLLKPSWTDRFNGYRYYSLDQLPVINRILALKELGFSLEQTQNILQEDLSGAELRGMMRLRQAELEQHIQQERARLKQIENRLQQLTQEGAMPAYDVVVKQVSARRVAGLRRTIQDPHEIPGMFLALQAALPADSLAADPAMPTVGIFYDSEYSEQGIDLEAAAPITRRATAPKELHIHQLPGVKQMACTVHKGEHQRLHQAHYALASWAEANRFRVTGPSREVYLQGFEYTEPHDMITEVQVTCPRYLVHSLC
jgi:DNA-binding transcriptional MerR regulator